MEYGLKDGNRPLESEWFQGVWGIYLTVLTFALMRATESRAGGFGGESMVLLGMIFFLGILSGYLTSLSDSALYRWIIGVSSTVGYFFVIWTSYTNHLFGLQSANPVRPFLTALILYTGTIIVVFTRLQRPISPEAENSNNEDLYKIHADVSWRQLQLLLSLSAIVIVGLILSVGTIIMDRQDVLYRPLSWLVGGLLFSFFPLTAQFLVEMRFLEEAYSKS